MLPEQLQPLVWSQGVRSLDVDRDAEVLIHRVLAYGSLQDLTWLFRTYSERRIRRVFLTRPQPIYTKASFRFVKEQLLHSHVPRYATSYLKTVS